MDINNTIDKGIDRDRDIDIDIDISMIPVPSPLLLIKADLPFSEVLLL